jgi:hypothetical protein
VYLANQPRHSAGLALGSDVLDFRLDGEKEECDRPDADPCDERVHVGEPSLLGLCADSRIARRPGFGEGSMW